MAIDRLSSTAALIAALREDVIARSGAARQSAPTAHTLVEAGNARNAPSMLQLRRQLAVDAAGVDLNDAQAVRHARTRFIRTILLWEFGSELRESPEWRDLIDGIDRALDASARGNEMFVSVLKNIRANSTKV